MLSTYQPKNMSRPAQPLPEPILQEVDNPTGLTHFKFEKMAPGIHFCDVLLVKASFAITAQGIDPVPLPAQLQMADAHHNPQDSLGSSLARSTDLVLVKPGADLYLTGHAHTDKPRTQFVSQVRLSQGEQELVNYRCQAMGPRRWQAALPGMWQQSKPQETSQVPLLYELSWGGREFNPKLSPDDWDSWPQNPSGSGYSFKHLKLNQSAPGIQWEPLGLTKNLRMRELTGFGPVARFWAGRAQYAGTYGKEWQAQLNSPDHPQVKVGGKLVSVPIMDYAPDFDLRFFQAAHPQLQSTSALQGDEQLYLQNIIAGNHTLRTALPSLAVLAHMRPLGQTDVVMRLPLDTVHINTDLGQVHLCWRLTLAPQQGVEQVRLELAHLSAPLLKQTQAHQPAALLQALRQPDKSKSRKPNN